MHSSITGLIKESECTPCLPGFMCTKPGLAFPDQSCPPGSFCSKGIQISCPEGNYCPLQTNAPIGCPPGTFSNTTGLQNASECQGCPPGSFCPKVGTTGADTSPCQPGYYCTGNSTDGFQNICEPGKFCVEGSEFPANCSNGTYQPSTGGIDCEPCAAGFECLEATGTIDPVICSAGFYCPGGSRQGCSVGTFQNDTGGVSADDCNDCLPGFYCPDFAITYPTDLCKAGYLCAGGAINETGATRSSGDLLCPVTKYCTEGTPSSIDCPPGTFGNNTGLESAADCEPCSKGYFCETSGLLQPTGLCEEGYYCQTGSKQSTENLCTPDNFCPTGSGEPLPCPAGSLQTLPGQSSCINCPAGFYCETGSPMVACDASFVCEEGSTSESVKCSPGFYGENSRNEKFKDCDACLEGQFCENGEILGANICSPGFYCLSGASEITPANFTCDENGCSGPCPPGRYCSDNVQAITIENCEDGQYTHKTLDDWKNQNQGAAAKSECNECGFGESDFETGYLCDQGYYVPQECSKGYYCNGLNENCQNLAGFDAGVACEIGSYNNQFAGNSSSSCLPCDAGKYCANQAIGDQDSFPCPKGYECPGEANPPEACEAGFSQNVVGQAECNNCTGGFYCPDPVITISSNSYLNIEGVPCEIGYHCPTGSTEQLVCEAGTYCPDIKMEEGSECPGGYYCLDGTINPIYCKWPLFCPPGSSSESFCPNGYYPSNMTNVRSELTLSCEFCEAGFYRTTEKDVECSICPEGFYCPYNPDSIGISPDDLPIPCPAGNNCPEGSANPVPCPVGTYGKLTLDVSTGIEIEISICNLCPSNTYNYIPGQLACFPCGSTATSDVGQEFCTCQGNHRAFQPSDASCVCESGFIYYNTEEVASRIDESTINSDKACVNVASARCKSDETRDPTTRSCISVTPDCVSACGTSGGDYNPGLGSCVCQFSNVPEQNPCSSGNCYTTSVQIDESGNLVKSNILTDGSCKIQANETCAIGIPEILSNVLYGPSRNALENAGQSFKVNFLQNNISAVLPDPELTNGASVLTGRKRRQAVNQNSIPETIINPTICLEQGDSIEFTATGENYPVYMKNDLRNSYPDFDYGNFRQLATSEFNELVFVFVDAGVYVFADSGNVLRQLIVSVMIDGVSCPVGRSRIQPQTSASFSRTGVGQTEQALLLPDWPLIIGLSIGIVLVLVLVVLIVCYFTKGRKIKNLLPVQLWRPVFRKEKWGEYIPPWFYKDNGEANRDEIKEFTENDKTDNGIVKAVFVHPDGYSEKNDLLQDVNVKTVANKLSDQETHIKSQLNKNNGLLGEFELEQVDLHEKLSSFKIQEEILAETAKRNLSKLNRKRKNSSASSSQSDSNDSSSSESDNEADVEELERDIIKLIKIIMEQFLRGELSLSPDAIEKVLKQLGMIQAMSKVKENGIDQLSEADLMKKHDLEATRLAKHVRSDAVKDMLGKISGLETSLENQLGAVGVNNEIEDEHFEKDFENEIEKYVEELMKVYDNSDEAKRAQMDRLKARLEAKRLGKLKRLDNKHKKEFRENNLPNRRKSSLTGLDKDIDAIYRDIMNKRNQLAEKRKSVNVIDPLDANKILDGLLNDEEKAIHKSALDQLTQDAQNCEDAVNRIRDVQLGKLRNRMKNRRRQGGESNSENDDGDEADKTRGTEISTQTELERKQKSSGNTTKISTGNAERKNSDTLTNAEENAVIEKLLETSENISNKKKSKLIADFLAKSELPEELLEKFNQQLQEFNYKQARSKSMLAQKLAKKREQRKQDILRKLQNEEDEKNQERSGFDDSEKIAAENAFIKINADKGELEKLKSELVNERSIANQDFEKLQTEDLEKFEQKMDTEEKTRLSVLEKKYGDPSKLSGEILENYNNEKQVLLDKVESSKFKQKRNLLDKLERAKSRANRLRQFSDNKRLAEEQLLIAQSVLKKDSEDGFVMDKANVLKTVSDNALTNVPITVETIENLVNDRHRKEVKQIKNLLPIRLQAQFADLSEKVGKEIAGKELELDNERIGEKNRARNSREEDEIEAEFGRRRNGLMNMKNQKLGLAKNQARTDAELDITNDLIGLRQRHYQEIKQLLDELPMKIEMKLDNVPNEKDLLEMKALQQSLAEKRKFRGSELETQLEQLQKEEDERIQRELATFEVELEQKDDDQKEKTMLELQQVQENSEQFQKTKETELNDKVKQAKKENVSEAEIQKIIGAHNRAVEEHNDKTAANRRVIQEKLKARMGIKRAKKIAQKQEKLEIDLLKKSKVLQDNYNAETKKILEETVEKSGMAKLEQEKVVKYKQQDGTKRLKNENGETHFAVPKVKTESNTVSELDYSPLLHSLSSIQNILNSYKPKFVAPEESVSKNHIPKSIFEPSPISIKALKDSNLLKYNFLVYCAKLMVKSKPDVFKPVSIIPCSNFKLPMNPELPEVASLYYDEVNAIIWITMDKIKSKPIASTSLDVCQMICLKAGVQYSTALAILAKDMYANRFNGDGSLLNVKFLN